MVAEGYCAVALVMALRGSVHGLQPLLVLQMAVELLQAQTEAGEASALWLFTANTQGERCKVRPVHAGLWGMARAVRTEAHPVQSTDVDDCSAADLWAATRLSTVHEQEYVIQLGEPQIPRLVIAPSTIDGPLRLHFEQRGAKLSLSTMPQPVMKASISEEVIVNVVG
eukprot:6402925-Prymnesium_polylepis.1